MIKEISVLLQCNVPFCWEGDPGIGKTKIIEAISKELYGEEQSATFITSNKQPSDFAFPHLTANSIEFVPPSIAIKLNESKKPAFSFIDELKTNNRNMFPVLMSL